MLAHARTRRQHPRFLTIWGDDALQDHLVLQLLQVGTNLRSELVTAIAVLLQTIADDILQSWRDGGIQGRRRRWLVMQDFGADHARTLALKWHFAGRHFVQHRAEGKKIRAGDRKSTRLNSSHVKISYAVFCLK